MVTSRTCCCGKPPSTVTKIIACVDMAVFTFFFLFLGASAVLIALSPTTMQEIYPFRQDLDYFMAFHGATRFYILGILMAWCLAEIGFAVILLRGAKERSYPMLRAWIFLIIVDCLFGMMAFIPLASYSSSARIIYMVTGFLYYFYRLYSLWVVHNLLREVISQIPWV